MPKPTLHTGLSVRVHGSRKAHLVDLKGIKRHLRAGQRRRERVREQWNKLSFLSLKRWDEREMKERVSTFFSFLVLHLFLLLLCCSTPKAHLGSQTWSRARTHTHTHTRQLVGTYNQLGSYIQIVWTHTCIFTYLSLLEEEIGLELSPNSEFGLLPHFSPRVSRGFIRYSVSLWSLIFFSHTIIDLCY